MAMTREIPDELTYLLTTDVFGHVTYVAPDGSLRTVIVWVDWDGTHALASSPVDSFKGRAWRNDPRASLSVADKQDPWRSLSISGRVTEIRPDVDLAFIDRVSMRYRGEPYPRRGDREIFVITPDRIRATIGRGGWRPPQESGH